jgi:hypothetical protein
MYFTCLEFVTNQFGGLSISHLEDGLGAIITGLARDERLLL